MHLAVLIQSYTFQLGKLMGELVELEFKAIQTNNVNCLDSDIDLVCFCSSYDAYKPDPTLNRLSRKLKNEDMCQGPPQSIARAKVL